MASSFFSDFGLMWYLAELKRDEFRKFKELLKQEPLQFGLKQIPWVDVRKATREDLANILMKHYEEQQAWSLTFSIFQKINRKDLFEKAKREITGYTRKYRAYVKEKFSNLWFEESITRIYDHFEKELTQRERDDLEFLFLPKKIGRRTVILRGIQGVGKTTFLVKLMLAWAEGTLYQERFSYVFYFCCLELKQLTMTSLAELIFRDWFDSPAPIAEITSQPDRLLFIIDGFEELNYDLNEPESDLCTDCMEQRPVRVVLSSLLRKKMFPESSLLIAAVPVYPREIEERLECPEIKTLTGFSESERKLYFCCLFQDTSRAMEAFSFIRENEQLFCMCQIPILCWVVCTCLKQEMERGRDLALTCRRTTSLCTSFILNLFTPKGANCPDERSQGQLKGLCSLAAEGMWMGTFVFSKEDLRRNGLAGADIPILLNMKALQKCKETENAYKFIHVCIQEFCAAMFYFIKSHTDHPNPAVGCTEALLFTHLKKVKVHWIYLGCFVFGLLNEWEQKKLAAFFGSHLCQEEMQQKLQQHLQSIGESEHLWKQVDFLVLCYCLFEMQNEGFVQWAMDLFQDVNFSISDKLDLVVSAYCLKHCSGLRKLRFSVRNIFKEEDVDTSMSSFHLICWHHVCSVLTTNKNLKELQVSDSSLHRSAFVTLCSQLKHPRCRLQKLQMKNISFCDESWLFFEVLTHIPDLKHLDLSDTRVSHDDVVLLCNALNNPECNIEKLLLENCGLSADDCEGFSWVLRNSTKLKLLNVSYNYLDKGLPLLCEALHHPACALEVLVLGCCYLSEHCWRNLYEVLLCNQSLIHLDISTNVLKHEDLKLLCEALKQPTCHLKSLCVLNCFLTADGCRDLALVLIRNPNLRSLQIGCNDIGDAGVKLLCEALTHPNCRLENLGLEECNLTSACCEDLSSALTKSKTLRKLNLASNALDHSGVLVLCEALRHPECQLQLLGYHQILLGLTGEEVMEKDEMQRRKKKKRYGLNRSPLYLTRLKKAEFDEETQRLLIAEEERNPSLTIIDG